MWGERWSDVALLVGAAAVGVYVRATQMRIAQLTGEKERLDYERRMQRHELVGRDDSKHGGTACGNRLGAMQEQVITDAQQKASKPVDHAPLESQTESPHSITRPLFCCGGTDNCAVEGWVDRSPTCKASRPSSVTSSLVNRSPSLCESEILLPIAVVAKNAPATWAPPPPNLLPSVERVPAREQVRRFRRRKQGVPLVEAHPLVTMLNVSV
tara:strand:+ start:1488 stop:2123 length:636 start_codon:yes stop_codon:yes gene_type:complete